MEKINLKQEWKKEWTMKSFKFLVIMSIILAIIWIGFPLLKLQNLFPSFIISILRGVSLPLYIISLTIYDSNIWKRMNSFDKINSIYLISLLSVFFIIYLFVFIGSLNVKILVFISSIFIIFTLTTLTSFWSLIKSRNLLTIIIFYLNLAVGSITLFAFIFAIIGGISPGNVLSYTNGGNVTNPWEMTYFSSGNFYTMGYGDIFPIGAWMKFITQIEIVWAAIIHIIVLSYLISKIPFKKDSDLKKKREMKNYLIKTFNKIKEWYLRRQKYKEREPNNVEEKLQEFLELLFIREELSKEKLRKELFLGKNLFNFLCEFAKKKGYICEIIVSRPISDTSLRIQDKGIDFLFDYRKIRAQEKSAIAMKWATIIIAISAVLTLYLTVLSTSPQVAVTDTYFCPASFRSYEDYSKIVDIPIRNIGKMQSQTNIELFGTNINGESIKNNYLIPSLEDSTFSFRITINNSNLDYAEYYFKVNYKKPFKSIGVSATKTCRYKKDETGGFIRQEL